MVHPLALGFLGPSFCVLPSLRPIHHAQTPRLTFSIAIDCLTFNTYTSQAKRHIAYMHSCLISSHTCLAKALTTSLTITHHSHWWWSRRNTRRRGNIRWSYHCHLGRKGIAKVVLAHLTSLQFFFCKNSNLKQAIDSSKFFIINNILNFTPQYTIETTHFIL